MCVFGNFIVYVIRVCVVISLSAGFTLAFANPTQTPSKPSKKAPYPPIKRGWESKEIKSRPITKGWGVLEISKPAQKIKARLTKSDYVAALQAIHHALSEVGDGKTYIWRSTRVLRGKIRPTNVFRDTDNRLCRHVIYTLFVGKYSETIEGIACRSLNGRWSLSG